MGLGLSLASMLPVASVHAQNVALITTAYPVPTDGTARFISPSGNDTTGTGTEAKPWRSLKKAVGAAPEGSTIVCRAGVYRGPSAAVTVVKRLTIQPYPQEKVWFKGSLVVRDWVAEGSIWRKNGWTYQLLRETNPSKGIDVANAPLAGYTDMVYVDGIRLQQVATKAEVGPGKFCIDYNTQQIFIGDNPAGKTVEATAFKRGLAVWKNSGAANDPQGSIIRGLGFAHYAEDAFFIGVPKVRIEQNVIVWNGLSGVNMFAGTPTDAVVSGNVAAYNGQAGINGGSTHNLRLENNRVYRNNVEGFQQTWAAAGVKFLHSDDVVIRGNVVEDNRAHAIWLDQNCRRATVVGNTSRRNSQFGIFFEISRGCLIAGNTVAGNGVGIGVANSSDVRAFNNTLVSNYKGVLVKEDKRTPTADEAATGADFLTRRNVFKNNIISEATSQLLDAYRACSDTAAALITELDYNAYYRSDVQKPLYLIRWTAPKVAQGCDLRYLALANFREATSLEGNGLAVDGVATNPFFVNPAADGTGDYRLKAGSNPAYRRGQPLPADVAQALGVPAGVPVDMGALFGAGSYGNANVVTSLTLLNADTEQPLGSLGDGALLNLATLPSRNLSLRANTNPSTVGSVRFTLDGAVIRTENGAPYAIAGNTAGDYNAWTPTLGVHTLTVTPYAAASAGGAAGVGRTYTFTVVDERLANPGFELGGTATQNPLAWNTTGTLDADLTGDGGPHSGQLKGQHWKDKAYEVYTSQLVRNLPNGVYTFRAWVKTSNGNAGARLQAQEFGGSTKTLAIPQNTWQWTQVALTDINVTNGQARVGFYSKAAANQWLHFDDVEFVRQAAPAARSAKPNATPSPGALTGSEVSMYPNPAAGQLSIYLLGAAATEVRAIVTNALGQTVLKQTAPLEGDNALLLNVNGLDNGIYQVRVEYGQRHATQRVVVAH